MLITHQLERIEKLCRKWSVDVQHTLETETSFILFGLRGDQSVVLKVARQQGDEWRCGEVLNAFDGRGTVRVCDFVEGAVLMERLSPGTSLASIALSGRDDEATEIIADVIQRMSNQSNESNQCNQSNQSNESNQLNQLNQSNQSHWVQQTQSFVTVQDWGNGFERYLASGDHRIKDSLVWRAHELYSELCQTQRRPQLLHGDLQHYNILLDDNRGWIAIDPKGVVGEIEYEIGASLRNPYENPELFASPDAVERRVRIFEASLNIDSNRALTWGFAEAVLSAIWSLEDGFEVDSTTMSIMLANAVLPLLK